jgi:antitoxin HicB
MRYAIELTPDDNDTLMVTCPDLPEVTSFGDDEADALRHALDAVETAMIGRMSDRELIPSPTARGLYYVEVPVLTVAKVRLYNAMIEQNLRKSDLGRLLGWSPAQVDRLFNLRHASRLDQIEAAFRVLGKRLEIEVRPAA